MKNLFIMFVVAAGVIFFFAQAGAGADLKPQEVWQAIDKGALLIDVRTAGEFEAGHLESAINIPYEQAGLLQKAAGDDKGKQVVVYCRSGRRSSIAKQTLNEAGYTNVINGGGYGQLKAARAD